MKYSFKTKIWEYSGQGSWHFATLPKGYSKDIKEITNNPLKSGFGTVRVLINIGKSSWQTSLFPDSKSGCYVVPIRKSIRDTEMLNNGSVVDMNIVLVNI